MKRREKNEPLPPGRYRGRGEFRRRVNTELHDALVSFGANDRTSRLSDHEFACQTAREVSYLARKSAYHAERACSSFADAIIAFGRVGVALAKWLDGM